MIYMIKLKIALTCTAFTLTQGYRLVYMIMDVALPRLFGSARIIGERELKNRPSNSTTKELMLSK
jgi:hypothetical protein